VKLKILLLFVFVVTSFFGINTTRTANASQLDFSWSAPKTYVHNKGTRGELQYIIWFYNLKNTINYSLLVPIEVFLKTDTGEKYKAFYYPEIMEHIIKFDEEYYDGKKYAAIAKGELPPRSTKHCVAMFEDVDPKAKRLDIFVTGISHFFFWRKRAVEYSYKMTYEKAFDHWRLVKHGVTKELPQRSHELESREGWIFGQ